MEIQGTLARIFAERASTVTTRRMDTIIGRAYALALASSLPEVITNGLEQQGLLNAVPLYLLLALNVGSILALAVGNWFFEVKNHWYVIHALVVLFGLLIWPIVPSAGVALPAGYTPFIWWTMGWGAISAGLGLNRLLAALYIVVVPAWWAITEFLPTGGAVSIGIAAQNAIYTFLISASTAAMVGLLRYRALLQDQAAEAAARAEAQNAATEAVEGERLRISSVVHNQVLTALNAALEADTADQRRDAEALAVAAIERLSTYESTAGTEENQVSVAAFFEALTNLVHKQSDEFAVSVSAQGTFDLPFDVASALTEATVQAVSNSLLHAGPKATSRKLSLRSTDTELKIAIIDNGIGFRPSRIPRNRLGIRAIIFKRVQQVGGTAHINSKRNEGTTVILEWGQHE
ncbi:MAG: hypothetical protein RL530_367 [Actinomycetota bacterium]|jgi:signal transduction histidine kinase